MCEEENRRSVEEVAPVASQVISNRISSPNERAMRLRIADMRLPVNRTKSYYVASWLRGQFVFINDLARGAVGQGGGDRRC